MLDADLILTGRPALTGAQLDLVKAAAAQDIADQRLIRQMKRVLKQLAFMSSFNVEGAELGSLTLDQADIGVTHCVEQREAVEEMFQEIKSRGRAMRCAFAKAGIPLPRPK